MDGPLVCDFCGRPAPAAGAGAAEDGPSVPLTWSTAVEQGRLRRFCETCSRQHLRAMEGKLDSEHW